MRIAGIVRDSVVDGVGVRDVVFFQGCSKQCEGCHNPQTWDYNGGTHWFMGDLINELAKSPNDVTISGGEPLDQYRDLLHFTRALKKQGKNIWVYTGNVVDPCKRLYWSLSKSVDVIVDGRFDKKLKDTNLRFRGSSNQRIIDLPESVKQRKVILWEDKYEKVME